MHNNQSSISDIVRNTSRVPIGKAHVGSETSPFCGLDLAATSAQDDPATATGVICRQTFVV